MLLGDCLEGCFPSQGLTGGIPDLYVNDRKTSQKFNGAHRALRPFIAESDHGQKWRKK